MLTPRLQEILNKIEAKSIGLRTEKEKELLSELQTLDKFLINKSESTQFSESVAMEKLSSRITSGPGGCPCCGR